MFGCRLSAIETAASDMFAADATSRRVVFLEGGTGL
jgi:hypothetical protein